MASQAEPDEVLPPTGRRGLRRWIALGLLAVLVLALGLVWANRKGIADNLIADELERLGIEATYKVERIGGTRQVLTDIVVGDPQRPDMTVARAEVTIRHRFGYPEIERVRLVRPRLYGTYRGGRLSFGELDPLLFGDDEGPSGLPDIELAVADGRGLVESDYGPVAFKLEGGGNLRSGFAGELAAVAPRLAIPGCEPVRSTLYGRLEIAEQRPEFAGPVRFGRLACPARGLALAGGTVQLDARADRDLGGAEGKAGLALRSARYGDVRLAGLAGPTRFAWRRGGLTARYDLEGSDVAAPQAAVGRLALEGSVRARRSFARVEIDASAAGEGVRLGAGLDRTLADAAESTGETLLGPILERIRSGLAREGRGSRLAADLTLRRTGARTSLVVPSASLRGGSGATLLALSRFQLTTGGGAAPRFAGAFSTGGRDLPRIAGRMDQRPGGAVQARLRMAEYRAADARLALPELVLAIGPDGAVGFSGRAIASGALPGGRADNLLLPISGSHSPSGALTFWDECTELRFDRLQFANLTLARQRLTLCPPPGAAIVRLGGGGGLRVAAGASSLQLSGRLGQTAIAIRSGPVGFAYPGAVSARQLLVSLGPAETAATFAIDDLTARIGKDLAGRFAGADVRLHAVPLDLLGASGDWRYADGRLTLDEGSFRLEDRQERDRFVPLAAEGASLALESNRITAAALLKEPRSGRTVAQVDLRHDLAAGRGFADLTVAGLTFDDRLQPAPSARECLEPGAAPNISAPAGLSCLALGTVANVRGTISGTGRIDWNGAGVTSRGLFSTESLDFAAAFGPVKGASGTIEFTDLLGLTTAPNQRLRVASINPGIEVFDGEILLQLRGGELLALQGGTWPFMGGTLTMRPIEIRFGNKEVRRYVLEIVGLDAARFVERLELNNIAATGIFDGTIPLVFDENGNGRVENGLLLSRPPGGNVSYVGELTYENLGVVANFAFDTLRSLDYRQMRVAMDGSLTGEIVTRVRMDGVSQGVGAEKNIVTRAIAGLPIRLDVNVRAPFYSLISNVRAMYDPSAIADPRELAGRGLLRDEQGNAIPSGDERLPTLPDAPDDQAPDEVTIQRRESEESP